MFCTTCGHSIPEGNRFCTNCGTAAYTGAPIPEPTDTAFAPPPAFNNDLTPVQTASEDAYPPATAPLPVFDPGAFAENASPVTEDVPPVKAEEELAPLPVFESAPVKKATEVYEYKVLKDVALHDIESTLNAHGKDGWRVISHMANVIVLERKA